jgi:hypothetical protein
MNIDDRLRAASKALKDSSVAQVDAASRLREIVRHTDQPVAHGHTAVLGDEPQESPRSLAPSCRRPGRSAQPQSPASLQRPPATGPTGRPGAHSIASPPAGMRWVGCSGPSGATSR